MAIKGNFFAVKREWSKLKDQILDHYLEPYLAKITRTGLPTRIADCFAGQGRFDDGSIGSPIIIANHVASVLARNPRAELKAIFIEQKYSAELQCNIADAPGCSVIPGEYEQCVARFLTETKDRNRNYFFYVDPYGIKSLDFKHFAGLKKMRFNSLEMLINLNTTGFLREGCRLLKLQREVPDWAIDLDYDTDGINTPERMDDVAGGDYWRSILEEFQSGGIGFHQAEDQFIAAYMEHMGGQFKYVVQIPIKERSHHLPKYRLVFATDHHEGLFLMADAMHAAWRKLLENEKGGQLYLFNETELDALTGPTIQDKILDVLQAPMNLRELLISLIEKHGIAHTTAEYKNAVKDKEGIVFKVDRDPPTTRTGRKSRSMDYDEIQISVGAIPQEPLLLQ